LETVKKLEEKLRAEAERREAVVKRIDEILADHDLVREAYVEELGCCVRFKKPNVIELKQLSEISDPFERAKRFVLILLSKADPEVTEEKIDRLPGDVVLAIARALDKATAPLASRSSERRSGTDGAPPSTPSSGT